MRKMITRSTAQLMNCKINEMHTYALSLAVIELESCIIDKIVMRHGLLCRKKLSGNAVLTINFNLKKVKCQFRRK